MTSPEIILAGILALCVVGIALYVRKKDKEYTTVEFTPPSPKKFIPQEVLWRLLHKIS